ncbi:hypothetical protein KY289_013790 [Solanum tuberosum]|nr:hypothetical protein KY289_013790 [Solanum tuberosum]
MVEVTIYFHHGSEWLTSPEPHYDKGWVHYWRGYDPDLISFIDLVNEYTYKNITDRLQDYKEIVKGMAFKDIAEAKLFCELYALAKKVELVLVKSDKKKIEDKLQSDPKYKVKEMKADLHRVFELNGLLEAVRTVLPEAHQRYCARHIEANWYKSGVQANYWNVGRHQGQNNREVGSKIGCCEEWKDDGFSPKSELLLIEYLKISKVCKVSGNGDNGYEVTEGAYRHIVNLREKKCTCRTWDLTGIPCPHAIKAMEHKKIIPKNEIDWLVGRPKLMREREKNEAIKGKAKAKNNLRRSFSNKIKKRQNPQEPIGSRVIGFRGDKYGVSEPTNLPIAPTGLAWNGNDAISTNQLQKLRPRRG